LHRHIVEGNPVIIGIDDQAAAVPARVIAADAVVVNIGVRAIGEFRIVWLVAALDVVDLDNAFNR